MKICLVGGIFDRPESVRSKQLLTPEAILLDGFRKAGVAERVMGDCSHANSGKDYRRQPLVARELARQIAGGEKRILGLMIESHLHEGRQDLVPGRALARGVSITDACLGWEDTTALLETLAEGVRARRLAVGE